MNLPEVELADVGPAWKCNKMIVKIKKYGYEINVRKSRRRVNLSTIQQNKTKHWGHWALLLQYIISRIVPVLCSGYSSPECNDSCFSTSRQISALIIVCVCVFVSSTMSTTECSTIRPHNSCLQQTQQFRSQVGMWFRQHECWGHSEQHYQSSDRFVEEIVSNGEKAVPNWMSKQTRAMK